MCTLGKYIEEKGGEKFTFLYVKGNPAVEIQQAFRTAGEMLRNAMRMGWMAFRIPSKSACAIDRITNPSGRDANGGSRLECRCACSYTDLNVLLQSYYSTGRIPSGFACSLHSRPQIIDYVSGHASHHTADQMPSCTTEIVPDTI